MNELIFKHELIENWIKILFIISTLLIIAVRLLSGGKIQYLIKFWNIHRYFIYKSGSTIPFFTIVNSLMFLLRVILFSIFFTIYLFPFKFSKLQFYNFIIISLFVTIYIILKYLIEKTFAIIFNYNNNLTDINRYRIVIKNLIAIHFYFYFIVITFNPISFNFLITLSFTLFLIYMFFSSCYVFKKNSNKTIKGLVYFIMYLCTFEIVPAITIMLLAFKY